MQAWAVALYRRVLQTFLALSGLFKAFQGLTDCRSLPYENEVLHWGLECRVSVLHSVTYPKTYSSSPNDDVPGSLDLNLE